jgi:hypothetical protein
LYLSGLVAAGAVAGLAASCSDQPRIKCTAGHGPFAVVYTHAGGDTGCVPGYDPTAQYGGEQVGVEAYNYPLPGNTNLDPNRGSLGMQSIDLTDRIHQRPTPDTARKPYSLGDWGSSEPGPDDFCRVPSMNEAEQHLAFVPAVPPGPDGGGGAAAIPAENIKYSWTNVRFYATASSTGAQLIADLTYSRAVGTPDGGAPGDPGSPPPCTETVKAVGLWPVAHCEHDDNPDLIDETKCSPEPDNSKGRPLGSGISPDLATKCDPVLKLCVLQRDPPSFK